MLCLPTLVFMLVKCCGWHGLAWHGLARLDSGVVFPPLVLLAPRMRGAGLRAQQLQLADVLATALHGVPSQVVQVVHEVVENGTLEDGPGARRVLPESSC